MFVELVEAVSPAILIINLAYVALVTLAYLLG
jgi:uncharacterized membrane protein